MRIMANFWNVVGDIHVRGLEEEAKLRGKASEMWGRVTNEVGGAGPGVSLIG